MSKSNTTALALPSTATITPKPTKTEIIEAMVERARIKTKEENDRRAALREKLMVKIKKEALKAIKGMTPVVDQYSHHIDPDRRYCTVTYTPIKTPELSSLLNEYHEIGGRIHFDVAETRKAIRAELTTKRDVSAGVQLLLANPEIVKSLDAAIEKISI